MQNGKLSLGNLKNIEKWQIKFDTDILNKLEPHAEAATLQGCDNYLNLLKKHIDQSDKLLNKNWENYSAKIREKIELLLKEHKKNVEMFEKISQTVVNAGVEPQTVEATTNDDSIFGTSATASSATASMATTTVEPTTMEPTTVEPTTVEPTTGDETTVEPTTVKPATVDTTIEALNCVISLKLTKTQRIWPILDSTPDPYVILKINNDRVWGGENDEQEDTLKPKWRFDLDYSDDFRGESSDDVEAQIFDHDLVNSDLIGTVEFKFQNDFESAIIDSNDNELENTKFKFECQPL